MLNEFLSPYVLFFPSLMVYSYGTRHTEAGLLPPGLSVVPVAFLSPVGLFFACAATSGHGSGCAITKKTTRHPDYIAYKRLHINVLIEKTKPAASGPIYQEHK